MAVDDISWWLLLEQLLTEHEPTVEGERAAVLDFASIHWRFRRDTSDA